MKMVQGGYVQGEQVYVTFDGRKMMQTVYVRDTSLTGYPFSGSFTPKPPSQKLDLTKIFPNNELAEMLSTKTPKYVSHTKTGRKKFKHTIKYEVEVELTDEEYKTVTGTDALGQATDYTLTG